MTWNNQHNINYIQYIQNKHQLCPAHKKSIKFFKIVCKNWQLRHIMTEQSDAHFTTLSSYSRSFTCHYLHPRPSYEIVCHLTSARASYYMHPKSCHSCMVEHNAIRNMWKGDKQHLIMVSAIVWTHLKEQSSIVRKD